MKNNQAGKREEQLGGKALTSGRESGEKAFTTVRRESVKYSRMRSSQAGKSEEQMGGRALK